MWPIISNCWNSDPHSRPSAFAAARILRRTILTFPITVIKRIAHYVDVMWEYGFITSALTWGERCRCLRHLCLVSQAYRECVTPFLYREIRLILNNGRPLSALMAALDSSSTKPPFSPLEPAGYGSYTQFISLGIGSNAIRQYDVAVGVRNLTDRLPGLRLVHIHSYVNFEPTVELSSLTTLTLEQVDLAILFDHRPTLLVLESLQRLLIYSCYDGGSFSRSLREPLRNVYLPNLLEISFHGDDYSQENKPFTTISTWTMPRLRSVHFKDFHDTTSPLLDIFEVLSTHGHQLQSLTLTNPRLQEEDISTLLALCSCLRSLDIDCNVSLFTFSASHARLEKIRVRSWPILDSMTDSGMNVAVDALKSLMINAKTSFPKLIEAKVILFIFNTGASHDATLLFYTGDAFLTIRYQSKTYKLFDGTDFVGAYVGHVVDCTDLAPSDIYSFLRGALMMVASMEEGQR
jgi:hypothetical protein